MKLPKQPLKYSSASLTTVRQHSDHLFAGIWINWNTLSQSEKFVCNCILLTPLWWLWGWNYLSVFLMLSIFIYHIRYYGSLKLQKPSLFIVAGICYGLYQIICIYYWGIDNNYKISGIDINDLVASWLSPMLILWYIKNYKIYVRLLVIAWAFSILVIQMLFFWFVIYFIWQQVDYIPYRSLFGILTVKNPIYIPGSGNSNYLLPYLASDISIPGMVRYVFFFHGPESLALVIGFICLLALDIKHKTWSLLLFSSAIFLLLLSGTRSVWVCLPLTILGRWALKIGKNTRFWLIFAIMALVSFVTLSIPSVNDVILKTSNHTAEITGKLRSDSTEVRAEIYRRTWEGLVNSSNIELIFGHVMPGETVLPGYDPARIGSHSFILSSLLYLKGLLGTAIFLTYWVSLIHWLYIQREFRPISGLMIYSLFSMTFTVMELESVVIPLTFISAVMVKKNIYALINKDRN